LKDQALVMNTGGKLDASPTCDSLDDVADGRALVLMRDRFGLIDTAGRLVIPAIYPQAGMFNDGLAPVRIGRASSIPNTR